jgi:hypothetical protein
MLKPVTDSLVTCGDSSTGIGAWGNIRVGILEEAKTEEKGVPGPKAKRRAAA